MRKRKNKRNCLDETKDKEEEENVHFLEKKNQIRNFFEKSNTYVLRCQPPSASCDSLEASTLGSAV